MTEEQAQEVIELLQVLIVLVRKIYDESGRVQITDSVPIRTFQ